MKSLKPFIFILLGMGLIDFFTGTVRSSWATSFYPTPFPSVVQNPPIIVRGTVGTASSDWSKSNEGQQNIYTFYELQVSEVLKGSVPQSQILIREIGGEKEGLTLQVPGSAQFQSGEDVIVFLDEKNSAGSYEIFGLTMGKLNLEKDESGREFLIGAALPRQPTHSPSTGQEKTRWSLQDLRDLIATQRQPSSAAPSEVSQSSNPTLSASSPSDPLPNARRSSASPPPAPQLQPSSKDSSHDSSEMQAVSTFPFRTLGLGLACLGIVLGWMLTRRVFKKRR